VVTSRILPGLLLFSNGHPILQKQVLQKQVYTNEIVARGKAIYEQRLQQELEPGNKGKILVINVETGEYEMDSDHLTASDRAVERFPGALLYAMKIGFPSLGKLRAAA